MEIKGKVFCFFEQSGTFKKEFLNLGIKAEDYDLLNNFAQTDHVLDLFDEIIKAYDGKESVFDEITSDDLIFAFFPCVHFTSVSQIWFSLGAEPYRDWDTRRIFDYILRKNQNRAYYFEVLNKFVCVCLERRLRMVLENPYAMQTFLRVFLKKPDIIDNNRMLRGDYMIKPTGYWFWNCVPTCGFTRQNDKERKKPGNLKKAKVAGQCSEERSLISSDYARNFICDFILGKCQPDIDPSLFDNLDGV